MVANHNGHSNGFHTNGVNGHTLICDSDYPVIDVTPYTPSKPKAG
jgi:hypothetical protein